MTNGCILENSLTLEECHRERSLVSRLLLLSDCPDKCSVDRICILDVASFWMAIL